MKALFGRAPRAVTADRGYGEASVDAGLGELGVKFVAIPRKSSKIDGTPGARFLLRSQTHIRKTVNAPRATKSQPRALSIS